MDAKVKEAGDAKSEVERGRLRCPSCLSTPALPEPQDAEVREAVERLENSEYTIALDGSQDDTPQMWADIDVLIAYVRSVQSPRLTVEQVLKIRGAWRRLYQIDPVWADEFRAAFPELAE